MSEYKMIINGEKLPGESTFDVINPSTLEVVGKCPVATPDNVESAVAAAKEAFKSWSNVEYATRQQAVRDIADKLEANLEELATILSQENGKPMKAFLDMGARFEIGGAIAWCRATAELKLPVDVMQDNEEARIEVHRRPLGVVGSILPWNWPVMIAVWHVIPAILAGNTVVCKPSSFTPLSTVKFIELANEVLPAGVLNIVTGEGGIGRIITGHSDIRKIVFTGSTPTGKHIMKNAADNMKRLTLELGGNDAGIILPDCDPKEIAGKVFATAFPNNGQTCAALKRIYVHEDIYEEMCEELGKIGSSVKTGDGMDESSDFGPVQNEEQFKIILELADDARAAGGRFLCGGEPMEGPGYFFPITIVADLTDGSRLVDEEPFGPIVPVIKYSDVDDAIERANNSPNGLGGSIWSNDVAKAQQLAARMECGTCWINHHSAIQPNAPFGGVKESGFGVEFTEYGLEEYTTLQSVHIYEK